jgi:DNA uptake protein ComE-like DNA-binding protein
MKETHQNSGAGWSLAVFGLSLSLSLALAAGCSSHPSNEQIQQQTAQTTQQVKQGAQQAANNAKVVAAQAEDKINAVAAGVKQGLQSGAPSGPVVDLNSGSRDQLLSLPGITPAKAKKIMAGRPYTTPSDLVSRNILTQGQYDKISARLTANSPAS